MSSLGATVSQPATSWPERRLALTPGREPILVVEADADFGRALVEKLAADGHPAELARTASHAEMTAGARPPRLVVLGGLGSPRAPSTCWKPYAGTTRKRGHRTSR
jgi:hypothetical protein